MPMRWGAELQYFASHEAATDYSTRSGTSACTSRPSFKPRNGPHVVCSAAAVAARPVLARGDETDVGKSAAVASTSRNSRTFFVLAVGHL